MGWEKHDNEIRTALQDGTHFLPEEECWNEKAAWQKMQRQLTEEATHPALPTATQPALRPTEVASTPWLYAAAALLLLLGAGFLWKSSLPHATKTNTPAAMATTQGATRAEKITPPAQANPANMVAANPPTALAARSHLVQGAKKPTAPSAVLDAVHNPAITPSMGANTGIAKKEIDTLPVIAFVERQSEPEADAALTRDSATARTVVKIRPGIIHLNELGYDGVQPPGFAPRKRYDAKAIIALQNTAQEMPTRPTTRKNGITIPL